MRKYWELYRHSVTEIFNIPTQKFSGFGKHHWTKIIFTVILGVTYEITYC